jgi:hypothetical protein
VPTKHPRIAVTRDRALDDALRRARPILGEGPEAALVHELAIRGAEAVLEREERRREAMRRLGEWSTSRSGPIDWDVLARVRKEAWRTGDGE